MCPPRYGILQHSADPARTAFTPITYSCDTDAKFYVPIAGREVCRCSINQRKEGEGSSAAGLMSNLRTDTSTLYRCRRIPYGTYYNYIIPSHSLKVIVGLSTFSLLELLYCIHRAGTVRAYTCIKKRPKTGYGFVWAL